MSMDQNEMRARPNIVLVHGAWADGSSWSSVIERLQADGYHVTAPQFPSRRWQMMSPGFAKFWHSRTDRQSSSAIPTAGRS